MTARPPVLASAPLRVVHVLTSLLRAGAEENTLATCRGQLDRGYDVWLVHGQAVDEDLRSSLPADLNVIYEPSLVRQISPVDDLRASVRIKRCFTDIEPDIVHTHQSKAGVIGRLAARWARVPIIVHGVHILPFLNTSALSRRVFLGLERLVAPWTDAFIAVSQGIRDENLAAGLGTEENNFVVYSGMDLERFTKALPLAEKPDGRIITIVGSLEKRKRHSKVLDAFARLSREARDVRICLLGEGPEEDYLKEKARSLGIADRVHFLGFRNDVERWIASSYVCVLASEREGLPRAVVQYVAGGQPVIVTFFQGVEEIVEDAVNGFIVGLEDFDGLGSRLSELVADANLRDSMAKAARNKDLSRWSASRLEPGIDEVIMSLVAAKAPLKK